MIFDGNKQLKLIFGDKKAQNYSNTIEALANFDKSHVLDLDQWYKNKIEKPFSPDTRKAPLEKQMTLREDVQSQDPEQLMKHRLI